MDLMQRYLKVFTVHTDYISCDFGTSYLDSDLPEDLAGTGGARLRRVRRQCRL